MKIGILSDTHLISPTEDFQKKMALCFKDVSMILHAGDLTSFNILSAFPTVAVHAVHGNMCSASSRNALPRKTVIRAGRHNIGLIHCAGIGYDFEDSLLLEFDNVDCIVFGHTHTPECRRSGGVLLLNPGSFMAAGRHGSPGTYAILETGDLLKGTIYEVPRL